MCGREIQGELLAVRRADSSAARMWLDIGETIGSSAIDRISVTRSILRLSQRSTVPQRASARRQRNKRHGRSKVEGAPLAYLIWLTNPAHAVKTDATHNKCWIWACSRAENSGLTLNASETT